VVRSHFLVTVVLHSLGPAAEVVATDRVHDVDDPLPRELGVLFGVGEVRFHLGVVGRLLQYGPDATGVVLGDVKVLNLGALNVFLLAADEVYTWALEQEQVLTLEEVDGHGVVRRQEGPDLHGQEAEDVLLGLEAGAE